MKHLFIKDRMPREYALKLAHQIATRLTQRHGASRVMLFGSLVEDGGAYYDPDTSDIDIYFEGVPQNRTLQAVGDCLMTFGEEDSTGRTRIDIKPATFCEESFIEAILPHALPA